VKPKIVLYGAGGHGKVVADAVQRQEEYELVGFLDDHRAEQVLGLPVLGGIQEAGGIRRSGVAHAISAVGDPKAREATDERLLKAGFSLGVAVHPSAQIGAGALMGEGCVVLAGAVVGPDTRLGRSCIVNSGASVDHDCTVGDYVHVAPGATVAGEVVFGARALVGLGAVILPGRRIGEGARVGAGAVVIADVPPGATVVGVPATALPDR
jgi:sugar O-acyltransferase (sialic acid O-acetyltransferase NeuD family)